MTAYFPVPTGYGQVGDSLYIHGSHCETACCAASMRYCGLRHRLFCWMGWCWRARFLITR